MKIEKAGQLFYVPDNANGSLVNGSWVSSDGSALIPWAVHEAQLNSAKLLTEKQALQVQLSALVYADVTVDNVALQQAVEQYNQPLIAESIRLEQRINEITGLLI